MRRASAAVALLAASATVFGCDNLFTQRKDDTWRPAREIPGQNNWPPRPAESAIARDAAPVSPPVLSLALMRRGQQRFGIYCAPCHGATGDGHGMIVERGFPAPPAYTIDRLRQAPTRHFYDVITDGYGVMFSYADRVAPPDRWAIAAYIRALQQSQSTELAALPAAMQAKLP